MASQAKLTLRPPPNVEFVQGFPGIPPLLPDRPPACVKGAVEVRLGGGPVKAKWIKVELRKVETLPGGGQANTYVELIGESPLIVWHSRDEWDELQTHDFPFQIRIPEAIPPSIALERNAGIKYELVASVLIKGKRGVLRREATPILSSSCQIVMDKHELHSAWPIYAQPESRSKTVDGHTLTINRTHTAFGPGDRIAVQTIVKNDALQTNHIRYYEFALLELVVYRPGPQGGGRKSGPQLRRTPVQEQKIPITITSPLHPGMQAKAELSLQVPMTHTTSTVSYAQRIEVNYLIHVKAVLSGGQQLALDLPVTMSNWTRPQSMDAVKRIGFAPNLSGPEQPKIPAPDPRFSQVMSPPQFKGVSAWPMTAGSPGTGPNGFALPNGAQSPYSPGPLASPNNTHVNGHESGGGWNFPVRESIAATMGAMPPRTDQIDEFGRANPQARAYSTYNGASQGPPPPNANNLAPAPVNGANGANGVNGLPSGGGSAHSEEDRIAARRRGTSNAQQTRFAVVNVDADSEPALRQTHKYSHSGSSMHRYATAEEEKRVIREEMEKLDRQNTLRQQAVAGVNAAAMEGESPSAGSSSATPAGIPSTQSTQPPRKWLSAEEEKARLAKQHHAYETAVQRTARMQALAEKALQESPQQLQNEQLRELTPPPPALAMGSLNAQGQRYWPTAEEEKQKLFRQAQMAAERSQTMSYTQSPGIGLPSSRSQVNAPQVWAPDGPLAGGSSQVMSPGKALYQSAMANMRVPSGAGPPSTSSHGSAPPAHPYKSAAEEKAEIRYRQALEAAKAAQMGAYSNGDPVPYEALYPAGGPSSAAPSSAAPSSSMSTMPPMSWPIPPLNINRSRSPSAATNGFVDELEGMPEKERMRRALAAADAAAAPTPPNASNGHSRTLSPPPPPPPLPPQFQSSPNPPTRQLTAFEEKEQLKAKYAAEDARSDAGTAFFTPLQTPRPAPSDQSWILPPSGPQPRSTPALPAPPLPPPVPQRGGTGASGTRALTALEEKALLKAKYADEENGSGGPGGESSNALSNPARPPTMISTAESDTPEDLDRDPSIMLGKQRVPAEPTPPPLPQKPPAEYYMNHDEKDDIYEEDDDDGDLYTDHPAISDFKALDIRPVSPFLADHFYPSYAPTAPGPLPPPLPPKVPL